jgi:hypothetical protein
MKKSKSGWNVKHDLNIKINSWTILIPKPVKYIFMKTELLHVPTNNINFGIIF